MIITEAQVDRGLREMQYYTMGRSGSFITSMFETISHADDKNINKIALIYPELVYGYLSVYGGMSRVPFEVVKE